MPPDIYDVSAQPLINYLLNPLPASANNWGNANSSTVVYDSANAGLHVTCTAGGTADSGLGVATGGVEQLSPGTYTFSVELQVIVADGYKLSAQGAAVGSAQSLNYTSLVAGQTVRLSLTFTVVSTGRPNLYVLRQTSATASEFIVRKAMVVAGAATPNYFDGNGGGVLQAQWRGAANGSSSVGYPIPANWVINMAQNPACGVDLNGYAMASAATGSGTITASRILSGGPTGGSFFRATWNSSFTGPTGQPDLFQINGITAGWRGPATTIGASIPVTPGQTYTASIYVRCSKSVGVVAQAQMITASTGANGTASGTPVTLTANTWTRLSVTATAGSNADSLRLDVDLSAPTTAVTWNAGDTFDATMAMITTGSTLQPYADGNTPGWQWGGLPGQSVSFGPAYTLDNIAGTPSAYLQNVTAGNTVAALPVSGDYTIFAVQNVPSSTGAPGMWDTGGQNRRLLASGAGFRVDVAISSGVKGVQTNTADFSIPHVSVGRINDAGMRCLVDGVYYVNEPATVLAAPHGPTALKAGMRDGNTYPQVVTNTIGLIPTYMDDWTAARVSGWLARQYGLTPPLQEIAGPPELWLDARYPLGYGTAAPAAGTALSSWSDISGMGRNFSQATASKQPIYNMGPNGQPTVVFDGVDDNMSMSATGIPATDRTVYVVAYTSIGAGAQGGQWLFDSMQSQRLSFSSFSSGSINASGQSTGGAGAQWQNSYKSFTASNTVVVSAGVYSTSPFQVTSWLNGSSASPAIFTSGTTYRNNTGIWMVGSRDNGSGDWLNGGISAVVVYPAAHDAVTVQRVTAWLARTFGLTPPVGY